jgi:hypothetical protein
MTGTETNPFGGYRVAIRTFYMKGRDLSVVRSWSQRNSLDDPNADCGLSTAVTGKAASEDSVCVIGQYRATAPDTTAKLASDRGNRDADRMTQEFLLTIRSDESAKHDWEWFKANDVQKNDGNTPELQLIRSMKEKLNKTPPTASLSFTSEDWELGNKACWWIECKVPPSVLKELESEIIAQRARDLHIGVSWVAGLVDDEHAPPSIPVTWGLFAIDKWPEPLRGHLTYIEWHASDEALDQTTLTPPETDEHQLLSRSNKKEDVDRLVKILARQMLLFTRACTIGFVAALALILIGYFLR